MPVLPMPFSPLGVVLSSCVSMYWVGMFFSIIIWAILMPLRRVMFPLAWYSRMSLSSPR